MGSNQALAVFAKLPLCSLVFVEDFRWRNLFAKAIKWWAIHIEKFDPEVDRICNHTAGKTRNADEVMEASGKVKKAQFSKWLKKGINVRVYVMENMTENERQGILDYVRDKEGSGYDYFGVISFLVKWIPHIKKWFFCSELWVEGFDSQQIHLCPGKDLHKISPCAGENWIRKQNNWRLGLEVVNGIIV